MAEAQKTKTATEMQSAEMDIFKLLTKSGYTPNQANGLIDLARVQASGKTKSVTISSDNPFTRNIQLADLNKVASALANIRSDPSRKDMVVRQLDIKGPEKLGSVQSGSVQLTGFLCAVKIGGDSYTVHLAAPLEGTGIKQQLSQVLETPGAVLQVTKRNIVTGNDDKVANFQGVFNNALSDASVKVTVTPLKKA